MGYDFGKIEKKWQACWKEQGTFKAYNQSDKPKYYVLDMFPYPSGAGLHVGHPLGYIASDIYARYKRHQGFNVLHPMGYDAYGLPAEQYAIQTGTHPEVTTNKNIDKYREQLERIGFSYDWDREVRTSDPHYYKWTQWTFIRMFRSWYNNDSGRAEDIHDLVETFKKEGNARVNAACEPVDVFTAEDWNGWDEVKQQRVLMHYRIAYLSDTLVNWCPALGTVLANDEVKDGFSERGGHPVEKKLMKQWSLRITAYAQRLLDGLDTVDWSENVKEMQRNWIGRSEGASVVFQVQGSEESIEVFTTRPDTLFGATFMVLAPEHELISRITAEDRKPAVEKYVSWAKNRSERERMTEVKKVTGEFTGAYAVNPLNQEALPIWTADYVLSGYGTGAIMAVPGHDSRDFTFARHFDLPIIQVVTREGESPTNPTSWEDSYDSKEGIMINSGFMDRLQVTDAITRTIEVLQEMGVGVGRINYRLRDAIFSRQRYWGEPFPIYYKNGMPYPLDESELPLVLPPVDKYLPTESGEPPLARARNWKTSEGYPLETNTMPGFAGSSGYYLRYMDPWNDDAYFSREANAYWRDVDLYLGGDEHSTGHLIYSRFWNKFLFDLGMVVEEEPFKKLINQGKIQGRSSLIYRDSESGKFVSRGLKDNYKTQTLHVDIHLVENDVLDIEAFRKSRPEYADAEFVLEDGLYHCGHEIEKMSKSKQNTESPDQIILDYGADTLRLYEMFLGPLEQHKPWDTKGIEGVFRFLKKLWRLFMDEEDKLIVTDEPATEAELKVIHKTIRKVQGDIERFSFNTGVSAFMICVNELNELKCRKREVLEPLLVLLAPYAPHIAEELWEATGHEGGISFVPNPVCDEKYLVEDTFAYPVSFNGKMRFKLELPLDMPVEEIQKQAVEAEDAKKWIQDKTVRKVIVVPKRIINVVIA